MLLELQLFLINDRFVLFGAVLVKLIIKVHIQNITPDKQLWAVKQTQTVMLPDRDVVVWQSHQKIPVFEASFKKCCLYNGAQEVKRVWANFLRGFANSFFFFLKAIVIFHLRKHPLRRTHLNTCMRIITDSSEKCMYVYPLLHLKNYWRKCFFDEH